MEFPFALWFTESGHPASGTRLQFADVSEWPGDPHYVPGTWARITRDGEIVYGPVRNTVEATREYNRRVDAYLKAAGLPEFQ